MKPSYLKINDLADDLTEKLKECQYTLDFEDGKFSLDRVPIAKLIMIKSKQESINNNGNEVMDLVSGIISQLVANLPTQK